MGSYHNTTGQTGTTLNLFEQKAQSQEEKILSFMRYIQTWATPEVIHSQVASDRTPITSTRRAITNLYKKGLLIKSDSADGTGLYGRPVHRWRAK